ncbi:MAG: papain-like cysteine protease family protein [Clostridia bacterium]
MKKTVTLALILIMILSLLVGCKTTESADKTKKDEMKIPYAIDLSPEDGADSVERAGDHEDSPYFMHPDFYNMKSTDSLTILTNFKTIQQSSEWSCGVTASLMVLEWYGKTGNWNEKSLAELRHKLTGDMADYPGTTLKQAIDIFNGVGGFTYTTTLDYNNVHNEVWLGDIKSWLSEGKPIMIAWNDWGGHWQVIIGYDTMGTDTEQDDVFIVADSYDTTDHNQDGYGIYSAERLMYNFTTYDSFPDEEGGNDMLFIVPSPAK